MYIGVHTTNNCSEFFIQIIYFYSNTLILKILFVLNYIPFMTGMYNFLSPKCNDNWSIMVINEYFCIMKKFCTVLFRFIKVSEILSNNNIACQGINGLKYYIHII